MSAAGVFLGAAIALLTPATQASAQAQGEAQDDALQRVESLRAEGRYVEALDACAAIPEPADRALAHADVLWYAGDLGGALTAAMEGLESAPREPALLWRATRLAVDLGAGERALGLASRLAQAAEDLPPGERPRWQGDAADFERQARELVQRTSARAVALTRARGTVIGVGVVALAALMLLARRG